MEPFAKTLGCTLLLLAFAGCAKDETSVDLGTLQIDAGRLNALLNRSNDGLDLQPARVQPSPDPEAAKRLVIDSNLKNAGLGLLLLRNRLMNEDIIGERDGRSKHWPAWIVQPPESSLSPADLQDRYEWLQKEVDELAEYGCEVGRQKSGQPSYCSLE
jgi:hypothetical protein